MARRCSWSPRGIRAVADKPVNHGDNITVLGAIRLRGTVALRSYRGAMNSRRFVQWFSKVLLPRLSQDDVVVMDNLRAHHAADLAKAAHDVGVHILYLPPYSPDLNPIEMLWNVFKRRLEKMARRTTRALKQAIRTTWAAFRNREFRMMFEACGYE